MLSHPLVSKFKRIYYRLRFFGNFNCVFDIVRVFTFDCFGINTCKAHCIYRFVDGVYKNTHIFYHRFTASHTFNMLWAVIQNFAYKIVGLLSVKIKSYYLAEDFSPFALVFYSE